MSSKPLAGQVAIVTGAARGIGAATAVALAQAGAYVLVNDILPPDETLQRMATVNAKGEAAVADVDHDIFFGA